MPLPCAASNHLFLTWFKVLCNFFFYFYYLSVSSFTVNYIFAFVFLLFMDKPTTAQQKWQSIFSSRNELSALALRIKSINMGCFLCFSFVGVVAYWWNSVLCDLIFCSVFKHIWESHHIDRPFKGLQCFYMLSNMIMIMIMNNSSTYNVKKSFF